MTFLRVSETSWVQLNSAQAENSKKIYIDFPVKILWISCELKNPKYPLPSFFIDQKFPTPAT